MTDKEQPKRKGHRGDRFTFKAVYSDEPMSELEKTELENVLIEMLVNRYEAEFPGKSKPREGPFRRLDKDT